MSLTGLSAHAPDPGNVSPQAPTIPNPWARALRARSLGLRLGTGRAHQRNSEGASTPHYKRSWTAAGLVRVWAPPRRLYL
eukprot:598747-Alexandrium_andersonii.AAC.1